MRKYLINIITWLKKDTINRTARKVVAIVTQSGLEDTLRTTEDLKRLEMDVLGYEPPYSKPPYSKHIRSNSHQD